MTLMNDRTEEIIEKSLSHGPLSICEAAGKGTVNVYHLWDNIEASEFFPDIKEESNYVLILKKEVKQLGEEDRINAEIDDGFRLLSYSYPFAGGGRLPLEKVIIQRKSNIVGNVKEVREKLLVKEGKTQVTTRMSMVVQACARWQRLPLKNAVKITQQAREDQYLGRLLHYYDLGTANSNKWYVDLYKIYDVFCKRFDGKRALSFLGKNENGDFQYILNENLRHFSGDLSGSLKPSAEDISLARNIARQWIEKYLAL
jgi:hypothetical protein